MSYFSKRRLICLCRPRTELSLNDVKSGQSVQRAGDNPLQLTVESSPLQSVRLEVFYRFLSAAVLCEGQNPLQIKIHCKLMNITACRYVCNFYFFGNVPKVIFVSSCGEMPDTRDINHSM